MKRKPIAFLLICTLLTNLFILSSPAEEAHLKAMTTTTIIEGDSPMESVSIRNFDEHGLIRSLTVHQENEEMTLPVTYEMDDQGNPVQMLLSEGKDSMLFLLKNRYEDGVLTEVAICDIILDDESVAEQYSGEEIDPASISMSIVSALLSAMGCLRYYDGYQNTRLYCSCVDIGNELRFRDGVIAYEATSAGGMLTETKIFTEDKGDTTTATRTSYWNGSSWDTNSYMAITADPDHIYRSISVSENGSQVLPVNYQNTRDFDTEQVVMTGYLEGESDPIIRYILRDSGQIDYSEQPQDTWDYKTFYDEEGRIIRTEQIVPDTLTTIIEWEYE